MHMFWSSLAELRLSASTAASRISFDWDVLEDDFFREDVLESFDHATSIVAGLEDRYTLLQATGCTTLAQVNETIFVADELVAAYILLDLRDRYEAIEAVVA